MDFQIFDIFGIGIGLRYLNKQEYQTKFGAITSIVIGVLITLQVILVGSELVTKQNPEVIFAERYIASPEKQEIKRNTFNFALGAQEPGTFKHFIDETVYTISATMIQMQKKLNTTSNEYYQDWQNLPIDIKPCKQTDFGVKETIDYFKTLPGIDDMYCIDYDSQDVFIEGNFDQDSYGVIQIKFELCKNKPTCKKEDEIIKILTNSFVAYYSDDIIINPKERNPFTKIGRDFYWNASPVNAKDVYMFYRNAYVESDNGIFFEEKSMERSTTFSYSNEQIIFGENSYYFSLFMRFEKAKESVYHRKYKKLDSALADIGGMAKALIIIGFFICMPINQLNLHLQLSNSLFSYRKNNNDQGRADHAVQGQEIIKLIETNQQSRINAEQQNIIFQQTPAVKLKSNVNLIKQYSPKKTPNHKLTVETQGNQLFFPTSEGNIQLVQLNSNYEYEGDQFNNQQNMNPDQVDSIALRGQDQIPQNIKYSQQNINSTQNNVLKLIQISKSMKVATKKLQESNKNHDQKDKKDINSRSILKKQNTVLKQTSLQLNSQIKKEDPKQSSSLDLSWTDYIKYYIFPWGKQFEIKKKQIDYSIEKIYNHLDMLYLVQKLLELEKIKQLLLDEDQIKLIQFLPKPQIDVTALDEQKKEEEVLKKSQTNQVNKQQYKKRDYSVNMLKDTKVDEKMKAKEAFQALQNIIKKQNLTEIDKKLIMMLDSTIFEYIDSNAEYLQELDQQDNAKIETFPQLNQFNQNIVSNQAISSNQQLNPQFNNNLVDQKQVQIEMIDSQDSVDNPIVEEHLNIPQDLRSQQQNKIYQSLNIQSIAQLTTPPYSTKRVNLVNNDSQQLNSDSQR